MLSSSSFANESLEELHFDFEATQVSTTVTEVPSLEVHFADPIHQGSAEFLGEEGLVAFFNPRINQTYQRKILGLQVMIREELLSSEEMFMCVNNNLAGFPTKPGDASERVDLNKTPVPIEILDAEGVLIERGTGNNTIEDHFIKIKYVDGNEYWVKKSVRAKGSEETTSFVTEFADCAKIQADVENHRYEEASEEARASIPTRSSRLKYVCTQSSSLSASETIELGKEHLLEKGSEVVVIQGILSTPFEDENGNTYIRVQHDRERYWVAEKYIKIYDDCASVQTQAVEVCVETDLNYYKTSQQITEGEPEGQFGSFQNVFRDYGNLYSKKVMLKEDGSEVTFVPVKTSQTSIDVLWVAEKYVPAVCGLDAEAEVTFRGRNDTCEVRRNDNFPLAHPARFDYYTGSAKFGSGRMGTSRLHGAIDLYSYSRYGNGSRDTWGTFFYAMDDGEVVSISDYGRQTKRITIQSDYGYTWNYAEVGRLQFEVGDRVDRGEHIGTTKRYARNDGGKYPAMLHTEKFDALITSPREGRLNRRYNRNNNIENPSCHVEYMEQHKTF